MATLDLERLRNYFASQPIERVWLFGSYARGEETFESDVDFLVDFDKNAKISLLKHSGIMTDLEDLLQLPVDVVREGTVYPEIKPYVDADKILIYERTAS